MKYFAPLFVLVFLASCSAPKYAAHFPSSNVETGYHSVHTASTTNSPAVIEHEAVVASATTLSPTTVDVAEVKKQFKEVYGKLSKQEKKEVRQLLKKEIKSISKNQKKDMGVSATQKGGIDHDLKLAAIFGAVGIVGLLISGNVFTVIGAIALIIGVVFFVKWLIRQ